VTADPARKAHATPPREIGRAFAEVNRAAQEDHRNLPIGIVWKRYNLQHFRTHINY
jgi:hypothetical protein